MATSLDSVVREQPVQVDGSNDTAASLPPTNLSLCVAVCQASEGLGS